MSNASPDSAARPAGPAIANGLLRKCPACGCGAMFDGFLSVADSCPSCGEALRHHRADDAPAWATMLIVGHLMVPLILAARAWLDLPVWAQMTIWPLVALGLCLALLPRVKGAVVAYQWAHRMHAFGE